MTLNRIKLGRAVTLVKQFDSVVYLIFLPKILFYNKIALLASSLLNFPELVVNDKYYF